MNAIPSGRAWSRAFSLVETVVAIGIFTFVIVGILALFPTAMRQHANSARESLGVQAAQQIVAAVAVASNLSNVNIAIGYGSNRSVNLMDTNAPLVLGFRKSSSVPIWHFRDNPADAWNSGKLDAGATEVDTLVRVTVSTSVMVSNSVIVSNSVLVTNLSQINIDVGYPAAVSTNQRQIDSFSTMVSKP